MKMRHFIAIMIACMLLFTHASFAEEDPVVVRVGTVSYPLSVAQFALDPYLDLAEASGEELSEEDLQALKEEVIDHLISLGVIENKLMETGNNDFTEDELDILRAEAASRFEQTWQQVYQSALSYDSSVTEDEVTSWMISKGYTKDAFYRELQVSERESRILDLYCSDVTVTDEEVQAYYQETFLGPDREKYEHDVPLYEKEILLTGAESFWTPEGYRYLKNILLAFPVEIQTELDAMQAEGKKLVTQVQTAYNELAAAAADGGDLTAAKEAYDKKLAALRAYEERYRAKEKEAIPLLQSKIDLIREQLASGISIDTLLKEFSLDQQQTGSDKPGMLYHPDSEYITDEMKAAVNAMTQIGELSEAFADEEGVHLMYYAGDVPGGERTLTAEEQEQLRESALYAAQIEKLTGLIAEWKPAYEIETDASLLSTAP